MVDQLGSTRSTEWKIKNILRKFILDKAEKMYAGRQAVDIQRISTIDYDLTVPDFTKITATKAAEGAVVDYRTGDWIRLKGTLDKYQTRVLITYETKARALDNAQIRYNLEMCAAGLADAKESEIINALLNGASGSGSAAAKWNTSSANIGADIADAVETIFANTTEGADDLKNFRVLIPGKTYGHVWKQVISGTDRTLRSFLNEEMQIRFIPTKKLSTSALVVVQSPMTAIHFEYDGGQIPNVESGDIRGVGTEYLFTEFFKTQVVGSSSQTYRIYKVASVL